ncbi:hypothetical protein [Paraburkholderia sp. C35]|uniref:hypothetical protein n=1 Tax=Paraburkholderia sp. C35 TaxID=2126993 RepID=UPI00194F2F9C|nr:hypothetical protein [Paraburkholderia sp. C35]
MRELDVVRSFLTEVLSVAHWHLPVDNEGIRRALTGAVTSGQLVPVINREWRALPRVMRPNPAPEKWPSSGTGGFSGIGEYGRGKWAAFEKAGPGLLTLNGEPVLRGPYDPSTWEAQLKAARAEMAASSANSSGAAWDATAVAFDFHPVESRSTATDADVLTIAARGVSEEQESECFGQYERDMMACDMIGAMYRDPRTFAECTRRAFSNYQICRGY